MLESISPRRKPGTRKEHDQLIAASCQECSAGCGLLAYVKDDRIVDVQGDDRHPVSRGRLCARGIAFAEGLAAPERITLPGQRSRLSGPFEAFDNWEKGIDSLAERLRRVKDLHGAESLIIGCDPEAGWDFYHGALRFARLWGTPHVYHPFQEAADPDLPSEWRHPTRASASPQWSRSRSIVLIEADLATTHPVAFQRVLEAQRGGAKIIAADAHFTTTLSKADIAVRIEPDQGNHLGSALVKMLLEEQIVDVAAAEENSAALQKWKHIWADPPVEGSAAAIGQQTAKIRAVARALGAGSPALLITAKRLAFVPHYGIWPAMAKLMGWHAKPGGGWYPLESGFPDLDPTVDLTAWQPAVPCRDALVMPYGPWPDADSLQALRFKALIGSGNCLEDFMAPLRKRINDLDLTVYFGSVANQTRQAAHMVFPATAWAEKESIVFTSDATAQWSPKIVKPPDACRTGLGFWMRLALRFGWDAHFPWKKANGLADQGAFYGWLFDHTPPMAGLPAKLPIDRGPTHGTRLQSIPVKPESGVLIIDAPACIGCQACTAACRLENDLPVGPRPIFAIQVGPLESDHGPVTKFLPSTCHHCDRPACVAACPSGAMQKRGDGRVFSDPQLCIGCRTCAVACPFGHPQLNPATGRIAKCDGCRQRIDRGLWPACALACPTQALQYGGAEAAVHHRRMRQAIKIARTFTPT
jgi:Fe-S-cluster-containing dehydrogenase component